MNMKWVEGGSLTLDFLISLFSGINRINVRSKDVCVCVCVCVNMCVTGVTVRRAIILNVVCRRNMDITSRFFFVIRNKRQLPS